VACAVWESRPSLATSAESWLLAGGPHHTVLSTAVGTEEFRDLADMLRTELVVIDANTTIPGIQNELRWSAAYHRLAARL
jgi:L-arabinose isomerase